MKYLYIFILSVWSFNSFSQLNQEVELTNIGLPEYRKLFKAHSVFPVYRDQDSLTFNIPARAVYKFRGFNDTLSFKLFLDNEMKIKKISQLNIVDNFELITEKNRLLLRDGVYEIIFSAFIQEEHSSLYSADTTLMKNADGYIYLANHFTRYKSFSFNGKSFNISIIDKDLNGVIDSNDLIAASYDEFFLTSTSSRSCFIKDTLNLRFEDQNFQIAWKYEYEINLIKNENTQYLKDFDLTLNKKIYNLILEKENRLNLSDLINECNYSIVSIWSEFCPPCIASIPLLNDYSDVVIGIEEKTEGNDSQKHGILFKNFKVSKSEVSKTNVTGYPNYFIIDNQRNILFHSTRIKEVLDFYEETK